jgi:hypothetical protein
MTGVALLRFFVFFVYISPFCIIALFYLSFADQSDSTNTKENDLSIFEDFVSVREHFSFARHSQHCVLEVWACVNQLHTLDMTDSDV